LLQLICSLTPSSTDPSTWLVIIWLKRWPARALIELPLLPPSVGVGAGAGEADGDGDGLGEGVGVGVGVDVGVGVGVGVGVLVGDGDGDCAAAGCEPAIISTTAATAVIRPEMNMWRMIPIMFSARTAWRWDHRAWSHRRNR